MGGETVGVRIVDIAAGGAEIDSVDRRDAIPFNDTGALGRPFWCHCFNENAQCEVQKLTPGTRVTLRVYSAGRFRDVQVTAGKASDVMKLTGRFNFGMPGPARMMEFNGPGGAMTPMRFRTLSPTRAPRVFKVEAGEEGDVAPVWVGEDFEDGLMLDLDDGLFDIENEIEEVPPTVIRDLVAIAIRDAQSALKQLAADGVV